MIEKDSQAETVVVDCDAGRRMGCCSFCCSMMIRLADGERDPTDPDNAARSCLDKDPASGRCVHQDAETGRCGIWSDRPAVCRAYDCNRDPLLQIVFRDGFRSLLQLVTAKPVDPDTPPIRVPYVRSP